MIVAITPRSFRPGVELRPDGFLAAERETLALPGDPFGSGLELVAIAIDEVGAPLLAQARAPLEWQRRLVARIQRVLTTTRHRGAHRLRVQSAAATVLLDAFEGARGRTARGLALRKEALAGYLELLAATTSLELRESMTANLDRCSKLLAGDDHARQALDAAWSRILPASPPYQAWFPKGSGELRVLCQVQDVFFELWRHEFRRLGFHADGRDTKDRIRYVRDDTDRTTGQTTRIAVDYVKKAQGIFTAMSHARTDVVAFLGHSDWWARVPRNLVDAPDQVGEKLIVLIMCFGKHFYHSMHARYPRAHIVTTKDPTEDPEDVAVLRHVFAGISARKSWAAIRKASVADHTTANNFIFPDDWRYVAGVTDEDRDGRLDRFDRFCNVGAPLTLEAVGFEESFMADPPGLHPRGIELNARELDGDKVFEAALMLNSLSYDNYWLDMVNQQQRVVAGGWHSAAPGDFAATRFSLAHQDGREIVRMSCSTRYARASQPALTSMVVYEGWLWLANLVPRSKRPSRLDAVLMGILLVAHTLGNSDYHRPDEVFHAFLRRWGFPAHIPFALPYKTVEFDEDWESGSPKSVARFKEQIDPGSLERLVGLLDQ